ncbi:unnamed protein product [Prorocentrum cordatum]|uniref:Coronin n=1 Tax=Prorocentrum cordatum TaxID=2364126 RepID=A0ABN9VPW6_9DINO|nr:unnamed protein product [Polarella glacialis]
MWEVVPLGPHCWHCPPAPGGACGLGLVSGLVSGLLATRRQRSCEWQYRWEGVPLGPHCWHCPPAPRGACGRGFVSGLLATRRQRSCEWQCMWEVVPLGPHCCKDGKVFLWDLTAGTVRQRLEGHADWVLSVAFSPHDANVLASGSSDGKIVLCGAPVVNIILSVRFDVDSFSPYAAHVTEFLRKVYNVRVYNPNNFNKRYCGHDGCCVLSYGCQIAFDPTQTPTNSDCWQSSYRWHCEGRGSWCRANLPVVMLAIVEDGVLGPGQKTEKRMAEQMGIQRLEVHTKKLYIGQLGGAELDKALLDVANLLRGLKFI